MVSQPWAAEDIYVDREGQEMDRGQGRMSLLKVVQNIQSLSPTFISLQVIMFLSTIVSGMPSSTEVTVLSTKGNDYYNNNRYSSWCGFYMELCLHKLQSMSMKQAMLSLLVLSDSLQHHVLQPTRFLCPWGFSRQEHWNGLPCTPPGDLPNPGIKPGSPALQVDSLPSEQSRQPWRRTR